MEYVERPTEVEAYAVAVEEGRRLGMTPVAVLEHLKNPWMTRAQVARLLDHVDGFLAGGALPNLRAARAGAPFQVQLGALALDGMAHGAQDIMPAPGPTHDVVEAI